jgi:hypothetical protein
MVSGVSRHRIVRCFPCQLLLHTLPIVSKDLLFKKCVDNGFFLLHSDRTCFRKSAQDGIRI